MCDHCSTETWCIDSPRLVCWLETIWLRVPPLRGLTKSFVTLQRRPSNMSESWTNRYSAPRFHLAILAWDDKRQCHNDNRNKYTHLLRIYLIQGKKSFATLRRILSNLGESWTNWYPASRFHWAILARDDKRQSHNDNCNMYTHLLRIYLLQVKASFSTLR